MKDFQFVLREAVAILRVATNRDLEQLFGERVLEPGQLTPQAAHAFGLIEGAAVALGLTALQLLDEVDSG